MGDTLSASWGEVTEEVRDNEDSDSMLTFYISCKYSKSWYSEGGQVLSVLFGSNGRNSLKHVQSAYVHVLVTQRRLEQPATHRDTCNSCRKFISVSFHSLSLEHYRHNYSMCWNSCQFQQYHKGPSSASVSLLLPIVSRVWEKEQSALIAEAETYPSAVTKGQVVLGTAQSMVHTALST